MKNIRIDKRLLSSLLKRLKASDLKVTDLLHYCQTTVITKTIDQGVIY